MEKLSTNAALAADLTQHLSSLLGLAREIQNVPTSVLQQVMGLSLDYLDGYRLLAPYDDRLIAFCGGTARPINQKRPQGRRWLGMMSEVGYQLARHKFVVMTGGTPPLSIMHAFIEGARRFPGAETVCLDIKIPRGGEGTGLIGGVPFHQFISLDPREAVAWSYADYLGFGPGMYGTLAEIFRAATNDQLEHKERIPIHIYCPDYYRDLRRQVNRAVREGLLRDTYRHYLHFTQFTTTRGVRRHICEVVKKIHRRKEREGPRVLRLPNAATRMVAATSSMPA